MHGKSILTSSGNASCNPIIASLIISAAVPCTTVLTACAEPKRPRQHREIECRKLATTTAQRAYLAIFVCRGMDLGNPSTHTRISREIAIQQRLASAGEIPNLWARLSAAMP